MQVVFLRLSFLSLVVFSKLVHFLALMFTRRLPNHQKCLDFMVLAEHPGLWPVHHFWWCRACPGKPNTQLQGIAVSKKHSASRNRCCRQTPSSQESLLQTNTKLPGIAVLKKHQASKDGYPRIYYFYDLVVS